jgi:hypothetical protein
MTTDRDDPERGSPYGDEGPAEQRHGFPSGDEELTAWAIGHLGAWLLCEGLSPSEIETIVKEAVHQCRTFQHSVANMRVFLIDRIRGRARRYMEQRGLQTDSLAEGQPPYLIDVIRTKEAMDTLTGNAWKVVYLVFYENKKYEEVALELHVHVRYVMRLLRGSIEQLQAWRPPQ